MAWPLAVFSMYLVKEACNLIVNLTGGKGTNEEAQKQKVLESVDKRLENLDKDVADKIKEQLGDKSSFKERLAEIKNLSKAERAELFRDLKDENLQEQQAINKELQNKLDKQEQRSIQLAQELQEARNNNDPAKVATLIEANKDNDKARHATRLELKKANEEIKRQDEALKDYFKMVEQNKPWYLNPNFKSPWLWAMLLVSCIIFYYSYQGFVWVWNQIKPFIWGDKE